MYLVWLTLCSDYLILLGRDHPIIICGSISECFPILRQSLFKELENGIHEVFEGVIVFIMGSLFMHEPPKAFNSIEVRCIGR